MLNNECHGLGKSDCTNNPDDVWVLADHFQNFHFILQLMVFLLTSTGWNTEIFFQHIFSQSSINFESNIDSFQKSCNILFNFSIIYFIIFLTVYFCLCWNFWSTGNLNLVMLYFSFIFRSINYFEIFHFILQLMIFLLIGTSGIGDFLLKFSFSIIYRLRWIERFIVLSLLTVELIFPIWKILTIFSSFPIFYFFIIHWILFFSLYFCIYWKFSEFFIFDKKKICMFWIFHSYHLSITYFVIPLSIFTATVSTILWAFFPAFNWSIIGWFNFAEIWNNLYHKYYLYW